MLFTHLLLQVLAGPEDALVVSTCVKGTGKFFKFCAKSNQESQRPPKCFISSEDGNCEAITGSNLVYHREPNLVFDPVLKGEEGSV